MAAVVAHSRAVHYPTNHPSYEYVEMNRSFGWRQRPKFRLKGLPVSSWGLRPILEPKEVRNCVHWTHLDKWDSILHGGLRRMTREFIYFSSKLPHVVTVEKPPEVLIHLDVEEAMKDGVMLFMTPNGSIVTEGANGSGVLPRKYFRCVEFLEFTPERLSSGRRASFYPHRFRLRDRTQIMIPILSASDVSTCVHGIPHARLHDVLKKGLRLEMSNKHKLDIHFSTELVNGVPKGMRSPPVLLAVVHLNVEQALRDGMELFRHANGSILTAGMEIEGSRVVPPEYFLGWDSFRCGEYVESVRLLA